MLRVFSLSLKIVLFAVVLVFALLNSQTVALNYLPGQSLEAPLVVLLLAAFAFGALLGVILLLPAIFKLRRERKKAVKQADAAGQAVRDSATQDAQHGI